MIDFFAALLGFVMLLVWLGSDSADDGIEYPLQRLAERLGTAARIDPGIALASDPPEMVHRRDLAKSVAMEQPSGSPPTLTREVEP